MSYKDTVDRRTPSRKGTNRNRTTTLPMRWLAAQTKVNLVTLNLEGTLQVEDELKCLILV